MLHANGVPRAVIRSACPRRLSQARNLLLNPTLIQELNVNQQSAYLVGQIVIFTDDPDLAARAANQIRQENLSSVIPNGTIEVSGHLLAWTSLPALRSIDSWQ